jgi:hypothetical protein
MRFDTFSPARTFTYSFRQSDDVDPVNAPTLIFLPVYQYINAKSTHVRREKGAGSGRGGSVVVVRLQVKVSDGDYALDWSNQTLTYVHDPTKGPVHTVTISLRSSPRGGASASPKRGGGSSPLAEQGAH